MVQAGAVALVVDSNQLVALVVEVAPSGKMKTATSDLNQYILRQRQGGTRTINPCNSYVIAGKQALITKNLK